MLPSRNPCENPRENRLHFLDVARVNAAGRPAQAADSLIALDPASKKLLTLRVPYPLGFYTRYVDGRIDDPKAGWKGRGLWSSDGYSSQFTQRGRERRDSYIAHFQLRPNPLAK